MMECDSESSLENGRKRRDEAVERSSSLTRATHWRLVNAATASTSTAAASSQAKAVLGAAARGSLSAQVMEYYQKYSQNSKLNQYFLPTTNNIPCRENSIPIERTKYYYNFCDISSKCTADSQSCNGQDNILKSYIPRERRRWKLRPPLIGQSSSAEGSSIYMKPSRESHEVSTEAIVVTEEKSTETVSSEVSPPATQDTSLVNESGAAGKASSPTSSIASHKPPLEWDSGADVGYPGGGYKLHQLSTIERMALARGCSAALRLDPEGTTEQQHSPGSIRTTVTAAVLSLTTSRVGDHEGLAKVLAGRPNANSTPLLPAHVSGSESEIEITPILKSHLPSAPNAAAALAHSEEIAGSKSRSNRLKENATETPRTTNALKLPQALKYSLEESKARAKATPQAPVIVQSPRSPRESESDRHRSTSPLRKSSSMHLLALPSTQLPLKRSQSELNLCGNDKPVPRLIFNSTSSIATVVNNIKPTTCNKLIQTSMRTCAQESIGVQVSVIKEEEKPPLPKRATSLAPRSINSILKNPKSTYKVQTPKTSIAQTRPCAKEEEPNEKQLDSSSESSHNASLTPHADDTENVTGRANSFEYFPGHIYENVPNGSTSQVSSVDTGRSNSTMPNTSSSIDEKLWGDSDSLVKDLERSVNILKSLVDANKLDKQVKKRLVHHVVKRLITAKYTDDKIEHNLEENVPWNPADARNKVYRAEIIQALAKNTTDSSDDWKPAQKKKIPKKSAPANDARAIKEVIPIPAAIESSNSDKFDRNTDRTVMDGRKARMGLRTDDCDRRSSSNTPTNKSESSECFLPQRPFNKKEKVKDMFITSTSNSSPQDQNRALLDAVVNSRRTPVDSSNEAANSVDWRIPATMSERRYELRRCNNTDSGDSKLVSYAEMEKRNQLVWITNEISHLSNLKKLLEQPKTKPERSGKSPPRKSKQAVTKVQKTSAQHRPENGEILEDDQLSRHWSSHCNLATCTPAVGVTSVRRLKKRNSCTQTATESSDAYSRTGSEIVSASIKSPRTKWSNVCVQTPRPPHESWSTCPIHRIVEQSPCCSCSERLCQFCKSKNSHQQFYNEVIHNEAKYARDDSEGSKETKNHLNAIKLKCTCEHSDNKNTKQKLEGLKKSTATNPTFEQHRSQGSPCLCGRHKSTEPLCQCSRECQCENKLVCDLEKMRVGDKVPSRKTPFEKSSTTSCSCSCKRLEEPISTQSECSHHSGKKNQPYYLNKSSKGSNHHDCCWSKTVKEQGKNSPQSNLREGGPTGNECKCCRTCGTVYQKDRKCGCLLNYPKGVAYELSFLDDMQNACDSDVNVEIKSINGSTPRSKERVKPQASCTCGSARHEVKRCECGYAEEQPRKFNGNKKATLQDYLACNNPGFVDNVETRRQYVSEIQRLRQLRKDRRMQLLAMATTSTNILTSPRPVKITKCVQKKIPDKEMRTRLRNRYFQLSEVRAKRKQQQLQEEARCNKLMAKIFCKKLQQKVLKGQIDLSQSVSVISNM